MSIDLGTGDGRLPCVRARQSPERLFVGVDANAGALRERSGRAHRSRAGNVLFVRAAVEELPAELGGVADEVMVVLPWGSLLAAVLRPVPALLAGIRGLCQAEARLRVVVAIDPDRDRSELGRLGVGATEPERLGARLAAPYAEAGFRNVRVRALASDELARWPSTWAKRLAHGRSRRSLEIDAAASPIGTGRRDPRSGGDGASGDAV